MKLFLRIILGSCLLFPAFGNALSKDLLTIGTSGEFETLHPVIATQSITKYMLYMAWRPLVYMDLKQKWVPNLIKEIPTLQNKMAKKVGPGLETTFEFKDDAIWGDGTPITCKDVKFSWEMSLSKNVSIANREPLENISSVKWDDKNPKKCVVNFKKARYDYYQNYPDPVPAHLEEPVFKKYGAQSEGYDHNTLYVKDPSNPGLYNGPYLISEVKLGSHVILVANPKWKGQKPYFQKVIFKLIPNAGVLEANLRSGNIDMVETPGGQSLDQAVAFDKRVKSENLPYEVLFHDGLIYSHIDLNLSNPILADLKVRQAISHTINKQELTQSLLEGHAKPAIHFINDIDPWYTPKATVYDYNKREAARLLDEAGWKLKGDYREKNGKKLSLTIMAVAGYKLNEMIEAYLQNQLKAVGIELLIKNEPARVFFGETTMHRNFEMAFFAWSSFPEQSPKSILHSVSIPTKANSYAGQNFPGWKNPEADKAIDALEAELDPKKRLTYVQKVVDLYTKDIPVIPMYYRQDTGVIPKGLKNFEISSHQFYESLYVENWSL